MAAAFTGNGHLIIYCVGKLPASTGPDAAIAFTAEATAKQPVI